MVRPPAVLRTLASDTSPLSARRGYRCSDTAAVLRHEGRRTTVQSEELDRIELHLSGLRRHRVGRNVCGLLALGERLEPLPTGSSLNVATGEFTWQPGVAFLGGYDFLFARLAGGEPVARRDVRIVLNPKRSNRVGPQTVIDLANDRLVAGWAADLDSQADTGVDTLHVWAYPVYGGRSDLRRGRGIRRPPAGRRGALRRSLPQIGIRPPRPGPGTRHLRSGGVRLLHGVGRIRAGENRPGDDSLSASARVAACESRPHQGPIAANERQRVSHANGARRRSGAQRERVGESEGQSPSD